MALEDLEHPLRIERAREHGGGAEPEREHQEPAGAERERERRVAAEPVLLAGPEDVPGVGVGRPEDVLVLVDAALGHAGRSRRVGDHRDVVRARVRGLEALGLAVQQARPGDLAGPRLADDDQLLEHRRGLAGPLQLLPQAARDHGDPRAGVLGDVGQLPRAQQRHRRDRDDAELLAREPGDDELGAVRHPEEDAVPPVDAGGAETVGEPVDLLLQLAVREDLLPVMDGGPARAPPVGVGVEERGRHVQANGITGLGQGVDPLRPERLRRETFLDRDCHPGPSCAAAGPRRGAMVSQLPFVEQPLGRWTTRLCDSMRARVYDAGPGAGRRHRDNRV